MAALESSASADVTSDVQEGTLLHFHQRFGHLEFDTIERMARNPASEIRLTSSKRMACVSCMEGKQKRNSQNQTDSGFNAPIDRVGGVICSDLKGPMTPRDRLGNRYLVNFVDHKSNYCRIFLARTKDVAAKQFEAFLVFFEKRFNCRIHVLRTDGGGEYTNIDLFCKRTGVTRQVSEAGNQASNGKAKRMHRTVLNLARSMMFACGLTFHFWGDAVQYASYIPNRSPTRANAKRASPLKLLTEKVPDLRKIVVFGPTCSVYRDPSKNSLQQRAQLATIVGVSEETKGYKVYLRKKNKVIVTQHVKNIDTLSEAQNAQLQQEMVEQDKDVTTPAPRQAKVSNTSAANVGTRKKSTKEWTRSAHGTRGASKRAQAVALQKESQSSGGVVNAIFD
ncbi:unnamed protein product [Hyaloperonospora brassicae]|uniref:Integrase catalytic domain-containing protein n=1 Tax=Hyaloperonospora brassicae TaxID=162125 RepID=A0AAV0SWV6_HYABA|nr:unnamed protein product [Hyaloperonospora brassicae]